MSSSSCLSDLEQGAFAVLGSIPSGDASMTRLRELGLLPGTRIQLIRRAPLGDPIEISVRGVPDFNPEKRSRPHQNQFVLIDIHA